MSDVLHNTYDNSGGSFVGKFQSLMILLLKIISRKIFGEKYLLEIIKDSFNEIEVLHYIFRDANFF